MCPSLPPARLHRADCRHRRTFGSAAEGPHAVQYPYEEINSQAAGHSYAVDVRAAKVLGVFALVGVLMATQPARADAVSSGCTGKGVIQEAPYACSTTRTIDGMDVTADLDVDVNGRAVVTFTISPPQPVDVPVSIHNYTGISGEPRLFVDGVIAAGTTSTTLVIDEVKCGQFDMKAVHTAPGEAAGRIAGPVLSWGQNCAVPTTAPTTTVAPATTAPPVRVAPATVAAAPLPPTGPGPAVPWPWAAGLLAVGAAAVVVSRLARRNAT